MINASVIFLLNRLKILTYIIIVSF